MRVAGQLAVLFLFSAPAAATVTVPANPITFTLPVAGGPVQRFGIGLNGFVGGVAQPALGTDIFLTLNRVSDGFWDFTATINNVSNASMLTSARISAFGFSTARSPTNLAFAQLRQLTSGSSVFAVPVLTNAPGGLDIPELSPDPQICFKAGGAPNNCAVVGDGGVGMGRTHTMSFFVAFSSALTQLTLHNFVVRYHSVSGTGAGGAVFNDASGVGYAEVVPEPASWAMLIAGFGLVGAAMRRRARVAAA
jgi:hypothetical protein